MNSEHEPYLVESGWGETACRHPARLEADVLPESVHAADLTAQVRSDIGSPKIPLQMIAPLGEGADEFAERALDVSHCRDYPVRETRAGRL